MVPQVLSPETKQLTEREELFLEALFNEAKGDFKKAKSIAGYPSSTPDTSIVRRLSAEIEEGTRQFLCLNAPVAVQELVNILVSEIPSPSAKEKLMAAKEILDRAGIVRREEKRVTHTGGVMILPAKNA